MTEEQYLRATDLAKLKMAWSILCDVHFSTPYLRQSKEKLHEALCEAEQKVEILS